MRDKLDGLSALLTKLSRVPGLGFLQDHALSITRMKHQVEAHISSMEAHKQGFQDGADVIRGAGPKKRGAEKGKNQEKPTGNVSGQVPGGEVPEPSGQGSPPMDKPIGRDKPNAKAQPDIRAQKKLLQQKLKR